MRGRARLCNGLPPAQCVALRPKSRLSEPKIAPRCRAAQTSTGSTGRAGSNEDLTGANIMAPGSVIAWRAKSKQHSSEGPGRASAASQSQETADYQTNSSRGLPDTDSSPQRRSGMASTAIKTRAICSTADPVQPHEAGTRCHLEP